MYGSNAIIQMMMTDKRPTAAELLEDPFMIYLKINLLKPVSLVMDLWSKIATTVSFLSIYLNY